MASLPASDELLCTFVPVAVYWIYFGMYAMLGDMKDYRLHPKAEEDKLNVVSKRTVVKDVLIQQAFQIAVSFVFFAFAGEGKAGPRSQPSAMIVILQILVGMVVMDTWQYFVHRLMHANKFLYKHVHSKHHTLVVPYAFGAQYNHPLEGLLLDTVGGAVSFLVSGMTPRTAMYFFSLATVKAVDDHCGLWLPVNLLQLLFYNNSAYHDIHHQLYGTKYNFSQSFFVTWDKLLGTHMPYMLVKRKEGGFESLPVKKVD
ncbi:hypothetical protein HPP92_003910 [Vanilla planifolia]|uniref:aldehyde oxygenase (deformylating) n=1 Tax=Vanilla planifolia TaxID=51239 RepID=A0A835SHM0_VANPL|nr:hypothetical protein HPP92_003910 [Vanilla planifolia]